MRMGANLECSMVSNLVGVARVEASPRSNIQQPTNDEEDVEWCERGQNGYFERRSSSAGSSLT